MKQQITFAETIHLTDDQSNKMIAINGQLSSPYQSIDAGLQAKKNLMSILNLNQLRMIDYFVKDPKSYGALIIDGVPVENDCPNPPEGGFPLKDRFVAEYFTLGIGSVIGDPIGYLWEKNGELLHHIVPYQQGEKTQSNQGSKVFLRYHNDTVYDKSKLYNVFNPDFLVLTCVKPDRDQQAATRYSDARNILQHFSDSEILRLRSHAFEMASPSNYSRLMSESGIVWSQPTAIIQGPEDSPEINVAANGVRAVLSKDAYLIDKLYEVANDPSVYSEVKLKSGQALIINNRKGIHARTQFQPTYDAHDRWLIRANIRCSLWAMREKIMDGNYRKYA